MESPMSGDSEYQTKVFICVSEEIANHRCEYARCIVQKTVLKRLYPPDKIWKYSCLANSNKVAKYKEII